MTIASNSHQRRLHSSSATATRSISVPLLAGPRSRGSAGASAGRGEATDTLPPCMELCSSSHLFEHLRPPPTGPLCRLVLRRVCRTCRIGLATDLLDLIAQRLVFAQLDAQKLECQAHFCLDAARGQQVHVRRLAAAVGEAAGLDPALAHQRLQAIVHLAETDAKLARDIALAQARIGV